MENISFSDPETESKPSGSFFGNVFSLLKSKKILVGVTVASTLILGGTAGFLAWRIQKTEEPTEAPAEAAGCTGTKLSDYCGGDKPELCDVSNYECHGDCLKAWGRCCDFCGPDNSCDDGHFGWVQDCLAEGKTCENGSCVSDEPPSEECEISWAHGPETFDYNGQEITVEEACLTVHAENCREQPLSFTRYHCDSFGPDGCNDNETTPNNYTINSDDYWKTNCLAADFGGAPPDCPVGQTDGAVGNPNIANDAVLWEIDDQYCGEALACDVISREPTGDLYPLDTVTITCSHSGSGFDHYNYRYTYDGVDGWADDFPGAQDNTGSVTYQIPQYSSPVTYQWQCQACEAAGTCGAWGENDCGLTFDVNIADQNPPRCTSITAHPTELPYFGGETTLTVQATEGDGGALSYSWGSDAGSIDPSAVNGDNKALWDLTSLTNDTYQPSTHYAWVKVSNDAGSSGCDDQDSCTADGEGCVLELDLAPFPEEDVTCDDLTVSPSPSEIELGDSVSLTCQGSSRWSYEEQRDNPYPIVRIDFKVYFDSKVASAFDGFQENEQIAGNPFSVDVSGQGPTWSATYPSSSNDTPIVIDQTGTWGVASRVCANVQGTVQCTNYAAPSP